jgi:hypothetical protein
VYMNPRFFEALRINANTLVKDGVASYEKKSGKLAVDSFKNKFVANTLELTLLIIDRIADDEEVSIFPLRELILKGFFELELELDSTILTELYSEVTAQIVSYVEAQPNYDPELTRIFNQYLSLISESINDYSFYSGSTVLNILQNQPEYQYSEVIASFTPVEISDNKIYTLFSSKKYWETFAQSDESESFASLTYAREVSDINYANLLIYENQLYKLKPDTSLTSREIFFEEDWVKYSPKRFDVSKSFKEIYASSIRSIIGKISDDGFDVNNIISDSFVPKYNKSLSKISPDELVHSFGGEGKQMQASIEQLEALVNSLGGYQGSLIGGFEYIAEFSEHLFSAAFGRHIDSDLDLLDGNPTFGQFNIIFNSKTDFNRIPGLKFLNGFSKLKSFAHGQKLSFTPQTTSVVRYNPIYEEFLNGITDFYDRLGPVSTYSELPKADLLLYSIESLWKRCNIIGDLTQGILSTLNSRGFIPGYEGLGSVVTQFTTLQNIFPPSRFFLEPVSTGKTEPGLTGAIHFLLNNYVKFSQILIDPTFPGRSMEFLLPWVDKIINKLEEIVSLTEKVGIGISAFIPNLSFKTFLYNKDDLIDFLRSNGFRDSEINQLLEVEDFKQLLNNFAPLSDSSDLKSFFKAYELTQLIYEMGGDEAINAYLSFLYSQNSLDSLLNILDISDKEKSSLSYVNLKKYPRLIGLLIGLTYAIDPQQLIKFEKILGENNLSLLESISFLFEQGERTIIKSPEEIKLLQPMIEQIITGTYPQDQFSSPSLSYSQASGTAPIGLKSWTKTLGDNLGRVESTNLIHHLYDKSVGLTPKELLTILNDPQSPNAFGILVDGFGGGELTKFLKYVNLTGLGFKLGFYKNSYQAANFEVEEDKKTLFLPTLLQEVKKLTKGLLAFKTVFDASFDYNFKYNQTLVDGLVPLIRAQNKDFEAIPTVIEGLVGGSSVDELNRIAGDFRIVESPGIGNSRLPNRVPALNSITPEQANILLNDRQEFVQLTTINQQNLSLIDKFIKFSLDNTLANQVNIYDENQSVIESVSRSKTFAPVTRFEAKPQTQENLEPKTSYVVPKIYVSGSNTPEIKTSGLGSNYVPLQEVVDTQSVEPFNPVKICEKFGGSNCAELYDSLPEKCVSTLNKSILPEESNTIPGVPSSSVTIDRPLGTFADYRPSEELLPISSALSPPEYVGLLPEGTLIGEKGEPILKTVFSDPILFEVGGGNTSEYNNTEFSEIEFIKAQLERNSEFGCAGFESPFHYQLCMNIMKCKRFSPDNQEEKYLDFCPKSLSGGRLK